MSWADEWIAKEKERDLKDRKKRDKFTLFVWIMNIIGSFVIGFLVATQLYCK